MGLWNFYFLAKLYLYFKGFIRLGFVWNILFWLFLILPIPKQNKFHRFLTGIKYTLSVVFGFLLLWSDSWFPPLGEAIASLNQQGWPSKEYLYRFFMGALDPWQLMVLAAMLIFCVLATKYMKLTPLVFLLLLIVPLNQIGQPKEEAEIDLAAFYKSESERVIHFEDAKTGGPGFDIIILHVCSLSWDDLQGAGIGRDDPFFRQFDYLFTDFNSVTSHSNPAAIRLLRANCGQTGHSALYNEAPAGCYLMETLRRQGYKTYFTLNHDGSYGHFADEVRHLGHLDDPMKPEAIPIQSYNFDGAPLFDDYRALEQWWMMRQESNANRSALYYNTISLHEGAHWAEDADWWKEDKRLENYKGFVRKLFEDTTKFFDLIASSGRNAVIIFVPEHGMALRGSSLQPAGLREVPLPQITRVPVGVKLIGNGFSNIPADPVVVTPPASYLSISYLLASFLNENPFGPDVSSPRGIIEKIPTTNFLSENEAAKILKRGEDYFLYDKQKKWMKLPRFGFPLSRE